MTVIPIGKRPQKGAFVVPSTMDHRDVARILADKDGQRAAAWVIRKHKDSFHRTGCLDLCIPAGKKLPRWMRLALKCLRMRAASWQVKSFNKAEGGKLVNVHRVRWVAWSRIQREKEEEYAETMRSQT